MSQTTVSRRDVVQGAGAAGLALVGGSALAACSSDTATTPAPAATGGGAAAGTTVAKADVPVGGGTIITDPAIVVTQPTEGDFKAFSSICTHQNCPVAKVENNEIVCTCHNSIYDAATGAVKGGPAPAPLEAKTVTAEGDNLTIA